MVLEPAAVRRYPMSDVEGQEQRQLRGMEEIPHVQGQRNPGKTVGVGATVRRYPTSKGKGEAPARW